MGSGGIFEENIAVEPTLVPEPHRLETGPGAPKLPRVIERATPARVRSRDARAPSGGPRKRHAAGGRDPGSQTAPIQFSVSNTRRSISSVTAALN
jgi:hypothetical protein